MDYSSRTRIWCHWYLRWGGFLPSRSIRIGLTTKSPLASKRPVISCSRIRIQGLSQLRYSMRNLRKAPALLLAGLLLVVPTLPGVGRAVSISQHSCCGHSPLAPSPRPVSHSCCPVQGGAVLVQKSFEISRSTALNLALVTEFAISPDQEDSFRDLLLKELSQTPPATIPLRI